MLNEFGQLVFWLIVIGLCVFLLWFFIFKVKHLKTSNVYFVDGGVKTGKSLICVMLAVKTYRRNLIAYYIRLGLIKFINLFRKSNATCRKNLFKHGSFKGHPKLRLPERPMLYSNMPLYKVKYNPLTLDVLLGKFRLPHKSVCLLDEATLIADAMLGMVTDKQKKERLDQINEALTLFLKLYGHMSHNGSVYFNSQNVSDLHWAFKRNTSCYLYITKNRKFPFFCLVQAREVIHDESRDIVNNNIGDVDDFDKPIFVSKRWYKYYDRFYLDVLSRDLPLYVDYSVKKVNPINRTLIKEIVTLGNYKAIRDYNEKMMKGGSNDEKA